MTTNLTPHALLESLGIKPEEKATRKLLYKIWNTSCSGKNGFKGTIYSDLVEYRGSLNGKEFIFQHRIGDEYFDINTVEVKPRSKKFFLLSKVRNRKNIKRVLTEIMDWVQG